MGLTALGGPALVLATGVACAAAGASWDGRRRGRPSAVAWGRRGLAAVFGLLSLAVVALGGALVGQDYSLVYVADNASRDTTWPYRLAGLWGGMSGSLLLWTWMLAGWALVASRSVRRRLPDLSGGTQAVLALEAAVFLGLLVTVSRPFAALAVPAIDGGGLTPILRHPAMLYHPPLLYAGYVGLAVPAAVAVAALVARTTRDWLTVARRFMLPSLVLLAVGMATGAHWAYVELGWGGYWAWDPVENGALLPWLAGIAFIHSALIARRQADVGQSDVGQSDVGQSEVGQSDVGPSIHGQSDVGQPDVGPSIHGQADVGPSTHGQADVGPSIHGLAFLAFGLSLLGAFLTRSGATASVHAFAEARAVGRVLLALLAVTSVALTGLMLARRRRVEGGPVGALTQAGAVRANNTLLLAVIVVVGFGQLYPLASGDGLVVTGRYFAIVTAPLALGVLAAIGVGPRLGRRPRPWCELRKRLRPAWWGVAALGAAALGLDDRRPVALAMIGLAASAAALTIAEWRSRRRPGGVRPPAAARADATAAPGEASATRRPTAAGATAATGEASVNGRPAAAGAGVRADTRAADDQPATTLLAVRGARTVGGAPATRASLGGLVAHLGVAVLLAGVAGTATGTHRSTSLVPGQSVTVRNDTILLEEVVPVAAPDGGRAARATLTVLRDGRRVATLRPVALVAASGDRVSEAALRSTPLEDLQVALRTVSSGGGAVVVEIFVVPLAQWVWWGALLVAAGLGLATRQRSRVRGS